jgi:carbonic anhydrase/acetyltransferase-like protein (isoleucine patch superfamily)
VLVLRGIQALDRARLAWLRVRHPGLEIDRRASTNLAHARYALAPGARLRIDAGVVTERLRGRLHFHLGPGAQVEIGENTWLRTEICEVHVIAFAGARIEIGPEAFLNGCHLSAKREVVLGRRAWVGLGSRIFDSDQHDLDAARPERVDRVRIGDYAWVASDVTVLRGVTIGPHAIVGTRSLVTSDVPAHGLAFGVPARVRGVVGDRSKAR